LARAGLLGWPDENVAWRPETVGGICGKCQSVNGFVIATSALCLLAGIAYAAGATLAAREPRSS
jgi:hypothetical protein